MTKITILSNIKDVTITNPQQGDTLVYSGESFVNAPAASGTGVGDMLKSVYDQDNNGIVDQAESVPWSGITGTPATFPPDTHTHDDRYYTETELQTSGQSQVHWDNITNEPATFPPATHTHTLSGLSDVDAPIPTSGQVLTWNGDSWAPATISGETGGGHTIQSEGSSLPQRSNLNFVGAGVTVLDDVANDATVVTISGTSGYMLKSVYDTNNDGIVNNSDMLDGLHATAFASGVHSHVQLPVHTLYFTNQPSPVISGVYRLSSTAPETSSQIRLTDITPGSPVLVGTFVLDTYPAFGLEAGQYEFRLGNETETEDGDIRLSFTAYIRYEKYGPDVALSSLTASGIETQPLSSWAVARCTLNSAQSFNPGQDVFLVIKVYATALTGTNKIVLLTGGPYLSHLNFLSVPATHTHDDRYYTENELSLPGSGGVVHWDNITGAPTIPSGGGHIIQGEGTGFTQRANLNFVGSGVTVLDDEANDATIVTISGSSVVSSGDMLKSVYDTDNDGTVDAAEAVPWSGVTGKPATFTPSTHTHGGGDVTSAVASATNADTVDGEHASAFADAVHAHSYLGNTTDSGITIANGGGGMSPQLYGAGGGAAGFAFHRPGVFAANFGVDTDNTLKIGGWSMGDNAYRIYHEGIVLTKGCRAYNTATQTIGPNAVTPLTPNSELFDTDGMWSAGDPTKMYARRTGYYLTGASIEISTGGTAAFLVGMVIRANGSTYPGNCIFPTASMNSVIWVTISSIVYLTTNQYVEIGAYQTHTGNNKNITAGSSTSLEKNSMWMALLP